MNNKYLKSIIALIIMIPWSIILILVIQIKELIIEHSLTPEPKIEIADTIINKEPVFLMQTPKEGLEEALSYYNIHHKDIVYAQAILETGNFSSNICNSYNNLFGLYDSKNNDYYKFNHWSESVKAYKDLIQYKYQYPKNYYIFLKDINYAADSEYISKIKKIVKTNDKRRSK